MILIVDFVAKAVRILLTIGSAVIVAAGAGMAAAALAGPINVDPAATGIGVGLLSLMAAIGIIARSRSDRFNDGEPIAFPATATQRRIVRPPMATVVETPLVPPNLVDRLADANRGVREGLTDDPFNMPLVEWSTVLDRVPELMAETKALLQGTSPAESASLRAGLAEDIEKIVAEAERRLKAKRHQRLATLRRWVAIRTGHA